jgi:hypothetical protein
MIAPSSRHSRLFAWRSAALLLISCATGCDDMNGQSRVSEAADLEDKLINQARVIAQKDDQLRDQAAVIQELRSLDGPKRLDQLVTVDRIDLERLSGGYDDDRDGRPDGLVLYLKLYDKEGDVLKAAGKVSIRVMDLAQPDGHQLLGQVELDGDALRPLWFGRLMTSHYTIKLPWSNLGGSLPSHNQLTVLVSFTDLLTGRSHSLQKVLTVDGLGATQTIPASSQNPTSQP